MSTVGKPCSHCAGFCGDSGLTCDEKYDAAWGGAANKCMSDGVSDRITSILSKPEHYGHSTWRLGNMVGMETQEVRKVLRKMERRGRVVRNERLSTCNNTYWSLPK